MANPLAEAHQGQHIEFLDGAWTWCNCGGRNRTPFAPGENAKLVIFNTPTIRNFTSEDGQRVYLVKPTCIAMDVLAADADYFIKQGLARPMAEQEKFMMTGYLALL